VESELRAWVESETGGTISRFERTATGASRATWLVDVERHGTAPLALVLRRDSGDGPLSGTEIDLAREAVVYRALRDTPVRIPRLVAEHEALRALLIERAPGADAFGLISDLEQRERVARDYMARLAELHALDTRALELGEIGRPTSGPDHARVDLRLWRRVFDGHVREPDPLVTLAFDWLDRSAPADVERTSLCHGDAGPGNFLFEGDRVTALLDWEFAHLGDASDDLAWVSVRAHLLGGFGDLAEGFRVWSQASGLKLEAGRIEYYRALVLARMATSCRVALGHVGEREMDPTVYSLLLPYLRFLLPDVLGRLGCSDARLDALAAEARREIEASPVFRSHARPLEPLELA
jgi:aminoglycoside phosphotransferase (APT) family kinase protein